MGPRITTTVLDALAARVTTTGARPPLDVQSAMSGQLLGQVPHCTPEDVEHAAGAARAVQPAWAATPMRERAAVLLRFHDLVLARQDEVLDIIQLENGKARRHACEEVIDVALTSRYYAHTASRHLRSRRRQGVHLVLTEVWEHHHPKGLVGIISPFNYPLTLGISDALPAIMAGNAVVAKPDERTPYAALWAVSVLEEAGMPAGLIQVLTGPGAELGSSIVEQSDFVMFTGSTRVGRIVAAQAAARLIDYSMELGGKNALLILDDARMGKTVDGAIRAAFSNTGQLCISIERMYVPVALWDEFTSRFADAARAMKLSPQLDYDADMGSLVSARQLETVAHHVDDAVAKGATVLAGGRARPDIGPFFYEPTILTGVREGMAAFREETFGPVVALYRVESEEEAIALANDSAYGLNFSVWTGDAEHGRAVATRLQAGTVNVNDAYGATWASMDAPMGGMKDSGVGSRHGEHGIVKYTDAQNVATSRILPVGAPTWLGPRRYAQIITRVLRVLKRLPGVR